MNYDELRDGITYDGQCLTAKRTVVNCGAGYCFFYDVGTGGCKRPPAVPNCKGKNDNDLFIYRSSLDKQSLRTERERTEKLLARMRDSLPSQLWTRELDDIVHGYNLRAEIWRRLVDYKGCGVYDQFARSVWLAYYMDGADIRARYKARFALMLLSKMELADKSGETMFKDELDYLLRVSNGEAEWNAETARTLAADACGKAEEKGRILGSGLGDAAYNFVRMFHCYECEYQSALIQKCLSCMDGKFFYSVHKAFARLAEETRLDALWSSRWSAASCMFLDAARENGNPFWRGREFDATISE